MDNILESLIEKGKNFSFSNNSKKSNISDLFYSNASNEFLAWTVEVEHFLITNYDENTGPVILFKTIDKDKFFGYLQNQFDKELQILRSVLISCRSIPPYQKRKLDDSIIINLVKNPVFWTVITISIGTAFTLGLYIGNAKFDNNLIELSYKNKNLEDSIKIKNNVIKRIRHISDSAHNILGHMPYNEMTLDTLSYRKVQTNIENAGAALSLNK